MRVVTANFVQPEFTAKNVFAALSYDPETGVFRRKTMVGRSQGGDVVGTRCANGYLYILLFGKQHLAHRLAWWMYHGDWPENDTDHINGDREDNRIANLREATRAQNNYNAKPKRNKKHSRLKGVSRIKNGKWTAHIMHEGKNLHLGCFVTEEAAHDVYCVKARELRGNFARVE